MHDVIYARILHRLKDTQIAGLYTSLDEATGYMKDEGMPMIKGGPRVWTFSGPTYSTFEVRIMKLDGSDE